MPSIGFDSSGVFIGGQWRPCAGGQTLALIDPSDGTPLARIARGTAADIDAAVVAAQAALDGEWGRLGAAERGRMLQRLSAAVLERADELARLEALDVGKPLRQGRADALALARYLEFYGGAADKLMGQTIPFAKATPRSRCASRMASPATSCRGTTRCRSSAARWARRWRWATPACSSRPRKPA